MGPQNSTATLFIDRGSWIQRLHPFTKLSYILLTAVAVYSGLFRWEYIGLFLLANILIVASGRCLKEVGTALGAIMLPLMLFMIPIHGFLYPGNRIILFDVYTIAFYQEGLLFALNTLLKLIVVLLTSLLFVFTTHPADLITALSDTGKSPSLAYLLGSPILLLAGMRERIETIKAAQRARGLHVDGNIFRRFYSVAPLIVPLVVGAIIEVEQRSIALEVRGFKSASAKTSLRIVDDHPVQRIVRMLMIVICVFLILLRFFG
ncbi:energy-coupling factor transporter transmembrane component T family protein [Desulforhopalus sp. 52FAK]